MDGILMVYVTFIILFIYGCRILYLLLHKPKRLENKYFLGFLLFCQSLIIPSFFENILYNSNWYLEFVKYGFILLCILIQSAISLGRIEIANNIREKNSVYHLSLFQNTIILTIYINNRNKNIIQEVTV